MLTIKRTNSSDNEFIGLVDALDKYLAERNGITETFYSQHNKLDLIKHVLVAYENSIPVACGAIKHYDKDRIEVKRMFKLPSHRGRGIAGKILSELEKWAAELNYPVCILETGPGFEDAIALYAKNGYKLIPNYEPYIGIETSVCFQKSVK